MIDKTQKELEENLNQLRIVNIAIIVVLSILCLICVYGLIVKDNDRVFISLLVIPIALSAVIPINFENIKKIKVELKSREENNDKI